MPILPSLLLCACASSAPADLRHADVTHAELAQAVLERFDRSDANPDTLDLDEFLDEGFLHLRLGLFEVYMSPHKALDKTHADRMVRVVQSLLDVQKAWLDWLAPAVDTRQAHKDLKELRAWAGRLRGDQLQKLARSGEGADILQALASSRTSLQRASGSLAEWMGSGSALGLDRPNGREPILLAADRREFLELLSFAGWLYPALQGVFWQQASASWTNCYVDEYKVLALEFAGERWDAGISMEAYTEDGLAQQITQLAANSLVDNYYGERIPPSLAGALAVNLTIDVFGSCNTRIDGDLRARRTEAFEIFVPGGASEGGWLPARSADSRWREHLGSDHFVAVLKAAQHDGLESIKRPKSRVRHFEIQNDGKNKRMTVSGPFLGSAALEASTPPEDFVGDYKEFLRAYRSCFIHWLRDESLGSTKKSGKAFAEALVELASGAEGEDLEETLLSVFGEPLSQELPNNKDLEGSFLDWLKGAKGAKAK